jgi:hypothetical protein
LPLSAALELDEKRNTPADGIQTEQYREDATNQ